MRVKYVGNFPEVSVPVPGGEEVVKKGGVIEVTDSHGRSLLEQKSNWQVDTPAKKANKQEDNE